MSVTETALRTADQHWAVSAIDRARVDSAFRLAERRLAYAAVGDQLAIADVRPSDLALIAQVALAYEVAAAEGVEHILRVSREDDARSIAHAAAYRAYELRRVLPLPTGERERMYHVLHLASLAYCGDRWADVRRWLRETPAASRIPSIPELWDERIVVRLFDAWVRLIRKNAWADIEAIASLIVELRREQNVFEDNFLRSQAEAAGPYAYRLIALYHWAQATEQLATYVLQGEPRTVATELDHHFEAGRDAAVHAGDQALDVILRWLHVASR